MHFRIARLAVVAVAALGLSASAAAVTYANDLSPALRCTKNDLCLWAGPHQTGKLLYAGKTYAEDIEPPIFPKSARDPLPDDAGCIIRLDDQPNFAGDEQELDSAGNHELDGSRVASVTPDCG